ncbi:MAG TPA: Glu/Leu/Phe/Val dehydrogenase dimerization domain-containing protein, partial [Burkholderiaceae bacterium]|nr:Glu/Leu/Phe/Val dehydrogenase dimerization domain-containing protein [Burkholderiaceae bacterium]
MTLKNAAAGLPYGGGKSVLWGDPKMPPTNKQALLRTFALAPCPTGWDFDPKDTVEIGRLAVRTGIFPLKEYVDGKIVHTVVPRP